MPDSWRLPKRFANVVPQLYHREFLQSLTAAPRSIDAVDDREVPAMNPRHAPCNRIIGTTGRRQYLAHTAVDRNHAGRAVQDGQGKRLVGSDDAQAHRG